jgi:hypothetical protein
MFTLLFGDYTFPNQTFEVTDFNNEITIRETAIPRKHGAIIQSPYAATRKIKISGTLHNSTVETTHTQLLNMQEALLAGERNFQYRSDRYLPCYTKRISPDKKKGTDGAVIDVDIELIAQVPFFCSAGASYSVTGNAVKGTTLSFNVVNGGNVFTWPVWSFCATGGTITDDLLLICTSDSNKQLRYRGVINNGMTLAINTDDMTAAMNSVDGLSNFEGDFLSLAAGTNTFQLVGATMRMTCEYRYRWY